MSVGRVHSIQSLGTLDGPGVRFVVFMQGCPLRCACCHNPDTWDFSLGTEYSAKSLAEKAMRYRSYFGEDGGVTLSGGEPICQAEFARDFFKLCKENGINTCLDTSGCMLDDKVEAMLKYTDRVLLDLKYTTPKLYSDHVGCELDSVLEFLSYLDQKKIPTTLRQVIIPTKNDDEGNIRILKYIADSHRCVDGIELLPFRKICQTKYDSMGIVFPFGDIETPDVQTMDKLKKILK